MKKILASIFLFLIIPTTIFAVTSTDTVWFDSIPTETGTHSIPAIGDAILVYAKINNATKDQITYTVSFKTAGKIIGTKTATLPAYTIQSMSIPWILPEVNTVVTADITNAFGKDKKQITKFVAPLGSVTVGIVQSTPTPEIGIAKGIIGKVLVFFETFRIKELDYFTSLKKKSTDVVVRTALGDVNKMLQPEASLTTPSINVAPTQTDTETTSKTVGYLTALYANAGTALFSNKAFYYVVIVLLALFIIRFIFSRLF